MVISNELIGKVKNYFGLNIYETKVWLALLSRGIASAGEIAEISGVPRSRCYDVLESLEKEGFAIAKIGKPMKYIAVKPTSVIEILKNKIIAKAEEKIKVLSNLKDTKEYKELELLHKNGLEPIKYTQLSGIIKGKININSYLKEMLESAESEVSICVTSDEVLLKKKLFYTVLKSLKEKNVKINFALNGQDEIIKRVLNDTKIKTKKTYLNSKFFIVDRKNALFILTPSDQKKSEEEIAIWINSPFLLDSIATMFEAGLKN